MRQGSDDIKIAVAHTALCTATRGKIWQNVGHAQVLEMRHITVMIQSVMT